MTDESVFSGTHEVSINLPNAIDEAYGVVLKWRRQGAMLEGLVSREENGRIVTEWLPALLLSPVTSATAPDGVVAETS
jgi:hypothetical protein